MRTHSSEGIVLSRYNYAEADRILLIFSKTEGKISLLAKGVRKVTSRKRGHLENFNYIKYSSVHGSGMGILTEAEIINEFGNIRKSLKKVSLAYYFMEVVVKITNEGEANVELFNLLRTVLTKLEKTSNLKNLRIEFVTKLLMLLGYWPEQSVMDPDIALSEVLERQISSVRVGKRVLI